MLQPVRSLDQQDDDHRLLSSPLQHLTSVFAASPAPPIDPATANTSTDLHAPSTPPQRKHRRKNTSLTRIAVPSFSTFVSQTLRPTSATSRKLPRPSPRHYSFAAEPSPKLVERSARPVSFTIVQPPYIQERGSVAEGNRSPHAVLDRYPSSIDCRIADFARSHASTRQSHHRSRRSKEGRSVTPPPMSNNRLKPSMTLEFDGVQRSLSSDSLSTDTSDKPLKSPSRIGAFFGWKSSSPQKPGTESPTTTFSERSLSPAPSPSLSKPEKPLPSAPTASRARLTPDIIKANSNYSNQLDATNHLGTADMNAHVQELERELAQVSAELAGSIRREMDLEDELERLKMDHSVAPSEMSRRGSDYFSDSGAGSLRYPISDPDAKILEEERLRRKAEQDRAQIKIDMAQQTQSELSRRRDLEELVQSLEDQLERHSMEGNEKKDKRVEELEAQLEENRRRLNQEKEARANFEDLYTALQSELSSGRRLGTGRGFGSIAEESSDYTPGLTRSGSLARSGSVRAGSLNRSGSVKGRQRSGSSSAPVTAEGMQEVEDQRDALHKALKLLISRNDKQQKDHERHIKKLTRNKVLASKALGNPGTGKSTYHREVSTLKDEVTILRKRTEDALEQKWQYEKSLGGIKMDLDRAEHETRGLRDLLQQHDILAPSPRTMQNPTFGAKDSATPLLSAAEKDRDQAHRLAEQFRKQAASMQKSGSASQAVAELQQAATRMAELYRQFDDQVKTNIALHHRLSAAVEKGELDQEQSTRQIQDMQKKLAGMEDSLLAAQQHSENTLNKHESQVRTIEEATSPRLQRFNLGVPEPSKLSPLSPGVMRRNTLGGVKHKVHDVTLLDASRTQMLERQVRELERMLRDAEDDMQHVVQRVNRSQLDVAELTTERDAAFTQMRKLQNQLVKETERAESLMGHSTGRGYDSGSDYGD